MFIDPKALPERFLVPTPTGYRNPDFDEIGRLPLAWLEHHSATIPDTVAVTCADSSATYAQLRDRSADYAGAVLARTGRTGACVALVAEMSIEMLAAMLGILRAGCIVVPLEPADGAQRNDAALDEVQPTLVVADEASAPAAHRPGVPLFTFTEVGSDLRADGAPVSLADPARILYTSGTTGRPKGFVQQHGMLVDWAFEAVVCDRVGRYDRVGNALSFALAGATTMTFGSLLVGAQLCLFDLRRRSLTDAPGWFGGERISWVNSTPNLWRGLLALRADPAQFATMRVLRLSGDIVRPADLAGLWTLLPASCRIALMYASTDTGSVSRAVLEPVSELPPDRLALGWPLPGRAVRVIDERGGDVQLGEVGEIEVARKAYVPFRFTGWPLPARDPAAKPPPWLTMGDLGRILPDGQIDVVGRTNARVKVRGFGVDLVEVDQALAAVPGVSAAAAVVEAGGTDARLVAHVVRADPALQATAVLGALRDVLPGYMVPSGVRWWDELPLTIRGKLDRHALARARLDDSPATPEPADERGSPGDDLEERLRRIWCEVLRVRSVRTTDRFFDVGGDSLQAYELVTAISDRIGALVSPASVLTAPTIREQADVIRRGRRGHTLVALRSGPDDGACYFVHGLGGSGITGRALLPSLPQGRAVWAFQLDDAEWARSVGSVPQLAQQYAAMVGDRSSSRVTLIGWSFGGAVAWEMVPRLQRAGIVVERIVIVDTPVPALTGPLPELSAARRWSFAARRTLRAARVRALQALHEPRRALRRLMHPVRRGELPDAVQRVEAVLNEMAQGWTPSREEAAVVVVSSERRRALHDAVWPAVAAGGCTIETIVGTDHYDLVTNAAAATGAAIARHVR